MLSKIPFFWGGGGYLTYILLMHHPIYQNDETISRCIDRAILIWHPFFLFLDFMMHIFFTIHRNVDFDNCRQSDSVLLPQSLDIKLFEYNSIFLNWLSIMLYMITCAQLIFFCCFFTENMYMYVLFYQYSNKKISQPLFHKLLRNGLFCRWPGFDTFFSC